MLNNTCDQQNIAVTEHKIAYLAAGIKLEQNGQSDGHVFRCACNAHIFGSQYRITYSQFFSQRVKDFIKGSNTKNDIIETKKNSLGFTFFTISIQPEEILPRKCFSEIVYKTAAKHNKTLPRNLK